MYPSLPAHSRIAVGLLPVTTTYRETYPEPIIPITGTRNRRKRIHESFKLLSRTVRERMWVAAMQRVVSRE